MQYFSTSAHARQVLKNGIYRSLEETILCSYYIQFVKSHRWMGKSTNIRYFYTWGMPPASHGFAARERIGHGQNQLVGSKVAKLLGRCGFAVGWNQLDWSPWSIPWWHALTAYDCYVRYISYVIYLYLSSYGLHGHGIETVEVEAKRGNVRPKKSWESWSDHVACHQHLLSFFCCSDSMEISKLLHTIDIKMAWISHVCPLLDAPNRARLSSLLNGTVASGRSSKPVSFRCLIVTKVAWVGNSFHASFTSTYILIIYIYMYIYIYTVHPLLDTCMILYVQLA